MKVDLPAEGGGQDRRKPSLDTLLGHCPPDPSSTKSCHRNLRPSPWHRALGRGEWRVIRDTWAIVCARPDPSAALPAMAASSGAARLTGAFEVNRDQFKRDPVVGLIT